MFAGSRKIGPTVENLLSPRVFIPVATLLYLVASLLLLLHAVRTHDGRSDLVSGDAKHYVQMAETFSKGDLSMKYVESRPHRQPLYPAIISPLYAAFGKNLFWLGLVNVLLATAAFPILYVAVWRFSGNTWIPAVVSGLYLINPFLMVQTTRHLMTEPLHILLMIVIIYAFLAYIRTRKLWIATVAIIAVGLDYLARPNGLFVFASLLAAWGIWDLWRLFKDEDTKALFIIKRGIFYMVSILVFSLVSMPSWLPRLQTYQNPLHHGYLSNYMWVDSYKEGHTGKRFAEFSLKDYAATHTAWDAAKRMSWGIWRVGFAVPWNTEGVFPLLILLATLGVVAVLYQGPPEYRLLACFALLQMLPLMWTSLSNPTARVPYGATFPFELAFAAAFLGSTVFRKLVSRVHEKFSGKPKA